MLFNSYEFIFFFLPITILGFYWTGKLGNHRIAISWLVGASLFFYGWWNPSYLILIMASITFNFGAGFLLGSNNIPQKKFILALGIIANLGLIGYYKYANFFIENFNSILGTELILHEIILPLAISFFTFQQITYLVDTYQGEPREYDFLNYCLFVTFFPQLIAGPIVHHKQMMPQFAQNSIHRLRSENLAVGFTIFAIGLFKKVILADGISVYVQPVFKAAENDVLLTIFEAWSGALAFSFQVYFDFSGYSDMAIGLARLFGILLPVNFASPYKAKNIADFWRSWHITLSNLIRDYLYYPFRLMLTRYAVQNSLGSICLFALTIFLPTIFTFFWVGLWHGAGWNFIAFGIIHGFYMVVYALWLQTKKSFPRIKFLKGTFLTQSTARVITFIMVVVSLAVWRVESMNGASNMLAAMFGFNGISLPPSFMGQLGNAEQWLTQNGMVFQPVWRFSTTSELLKWLISLFIFTNFLPNTQQLLCGYRPIFEARKGEIEHIRYRWLEWQPTKTWAFFITGIFILSMLLITKNNEFIYFQF